MSSPKVPKETLNEGEHYAGVLLGKNGTPDHHLVLLPGEANCINWNGARDWALQAGGELPTRRELALLFANLKEEFVGWYWSSEQDESGRCCVWGQDFNSGHQTIYGRQYPRARARAVRRLLVESDRDLIR
jgi:hypothetical protein